MTNMTIDPISADPLVLAWIGDAYLTLAIREWLVSMSDAGSGALHVKMKAFVSATAQARIWERIYDSLTEPEKDLGRRARNRHNSSFAKNSTIADYKKATALEAVLGYHYLTKNQKRLEELMSMIIQKE
ncbi:MAG TPA: ribonuclease III domain-containing protein [Clostridia bacterium]|mgnify:CR=1 FL=1|jgi:ribonuclease-3 family protein